ncbi:MAG: glycosyltransferase family 39 protein [Candidatus Omnitrophica bacterium]|nr:glycosyltransferase family 39 protein [Candidatus Omnitrophota bacterium]
MINQKRIVEMWKRYGREGTLLLFFLWGMYLRFRLLASRDLWVDEVATLNVIKGPLKPFWLNVPLPAQLTAFPGQYILTWPFVQIFGDNKWAIMIPHILSTVIGYYFLYRICQRYFKRSLSYIIAFVLFSFNPELVFHSFEFREYAVLPTLSLAIFYFSEMLICQPMKLTLMQKWFVGFLFVSTVIYHAYGGMIIFLITLFFLLKEIRTRSVSEIWATSWRFYGSFCLIALPIFVWYFMGSRAMGAAMWMDTFQFIPSPFMDLGGFLKAIFCNLTGHPKLYVLFVGIIFSFLIPHQNRWVQMGFFLLLVILPIELILLMDLSRSYWFLQRQFVWITPLFLFFIGWCWDDVIGSFKNFLPSKR